MHTSHVLLGLALVSFSSASPLARSRQSRSVWPDIDSKISVGKGFTASQGRSKKSKAGAVSRANVYRKFGKAMPDHVASAAAAYQDGTGVAVPEIDDVEYLVNVTVGGQVVSLDFDSGSSDLWVYSSEQSSTDLTGHSFYTPSATATELTGETWSITYADGSGASGNVYMDWVAVGATNVSSQAVEAASQVSSDFLSDTDSDGLLGLAFGSLNTVTPDAQSTFMENAISEGILNQSLFTADLKHGAPGTYDFGFIDTSKYNGSITYTAVNSDPGYWTIEGTGYGVGDNFTSQTIEAIADTGTTLIYLDDTICEDYYASVSGAQNSDTYGGYVFDCDADLPDFSFGIEDFQSVVPGAYMSYAPVEDGSSTCYGGLQSNDGLGLSILGDVWVKSVFVVFDVGNLQLGVASKVTT